MHEQPRRLTLFSIPVLSAANKYIFLSFASSKIGNSGLIHFSVIELNILLVELSAWFESAQLVGNIKKLIFLPQKNLQYSKSKSS